MSSGRIASLWFVLILLIAGTVEGLSYFALGYLKNTRGIEYDPFPLDRNLPRHEDVRESLQRAIRGLLADG